METFENAVSLLKEIGLTDLESRIYLLLLYEGRLRPSELTSKLSIHKSSFYNAMNMLETKGLISKIKINNIVYVRASSTNTLFGLIENIESELKKHLSTIKPKEQTYIETYSGRRSIRALMRRMLKEIKDGEKIYYDFGASGRFRVVIPIFWNYWQAYKKREEIKAKVIFTQEAKQLGTLIKDYVGYARFLPKGVTSFTDTFIYNDVVVLFIWSDNPVAVYIKDKKNAESYKKQFRAMWRKFNKK